MTRALLIGPDQQAAIKAAIARAAEHPASLETIKAIAAKVPQDRPVMSLKDRADVPRDPLHSAVRVQYAAQALNCLAGAINTALGLSGLLSGRPVFGVFFLMVAFWSATLFCESRQYQADERAMLRKLYEVRRQIADWQR